MNIEAVVVKIASRCNINCTYCYMYNHADKSYKSQPKFMSKETTLALREKIRNHCVQHKLKKFHIALHGGEPLLTKIEDLNFFLETLNQLNNEGISIIFGMQTNGILFNKEYCDLFNKYDVGVGVSLDGDKETNDLYRVDKKGEGTFDKVKEGVAIAKKYLDNNLACLSVINTSSSPIKLYETYKDLGFTAIDLLLLDENYDTINEFKEIENANWLIELFDYWYNLETENKIKIHKFQDFISYILGNEIGTESAGKGENKLAIIETNGDIEAVDVLKICGEGFTKHKFNLLSNEFDDIFQNDLMKIYYNSKQMLCKKCLACPVVDICGGGYLPHRYSSVNGFNNPSIYCNDLLKLITHIQNQIIESLPSEIIEETGIKKLTFENALILQKENMLINEEPPHSEFLKSFKKNEIINA